MPGPRPSQADTRVSTTTKQKRRIQLNMEENRRKGHSLQDGTVPERKRGPPKHSGFYLYSLNYCLAGVAWAPVAGGDEEEGGGGGGRPSSLPFSPSVFLSPPSFPFFIVSFPSSPPPPSPPSPPSSALHHPSSSSSFSLPPSSYRSPPITFHPFVSLLPPSPFIIASPPYPFNPPPSLSLLPSSPFIIRLSSHHPFISSLRLSSPPPPSPSLPPLLHNPFILSVFFSLLPPSPSLPPLPLPLLHRLSPSPSAPPAKLEREDSENTQLRRAICEAREGAQRKAAKRKPDVVLSRSYPGATVHEEYACMLNQTNIGQNNNKFYVIQVAKDSGDFLCFTRWGRVGEEGQWNIDCMEKAEDAIKAFEKKFKDKTRNNWADRDNFEPVAKKYTLLEMVSAASVYLPSPPSSSLFPSPSVTPLSPIPLPPPLCPSPFPNPLSVHPSPPLSVHLPSQPPLYDDSDEEEDAVDSSVPKKELVSYDGPCNLHKRTILMIKLIFSDNMFVNQMADMSLDVKKMPLGKLSKLQIAKGLEALIDIEDAIKKNKPRSVLMELTSKFYTLIPHNFGRSAPPVIDTDEVVQKKKEVMLTLSDIELTQSLQKEKENKDLHPLLEKYEMFGLRLGIRRKVFLRIYACPQTRKGPLLDVWRVDRKGEKERFAAHDAIQHRKLLWHGTNVAVVAAILKAGLRIMPHSGGLVGRGIYFASEHAKSSWYVRSHCGVFEGESNAPNGYDSVVARGSREPDPKKNKKVVFDGKDVIVPVGKPVPQKEWAQSGFCQSEYLVYKESQARIRYVLKFSFN
ncbi:hypothetical protein C7M84_011516 [Penaeus vannamei]|uniref:Poly [ADP-ribose] polymerase n=1 Tax=Penaeus vannamei TaxID=6689 RepID=A0A3R7M2S4_PENVA|nr:hypothetical protein C7M84_011516 [Penaeus vannamei]